MGRKVPLPPHVRATLYRLFGDAVDLVEIVEHSWFTKLHGRAHATTRRRRIYLRGSAADFFDDPVLMLHEYFHVLRQWEPRELSVGRYLLEWFRRGYWDNRYEIEAREFTEDQVHRFRAWMAQDRARLGPASGAEPTRDA
ncbi:MAG: hypothetical protein U1F18_00430 [Steroidobacteraceae bacterium]|jgi:hypothetical protein